MKNHVQFGVALLALVSAGSGCQYWAKIHGSNNHSPSVAAIPDRSAALVWVHEAESESQVRGDVLHHVGMFTSGLRPGRRYNLLARSDTGPLRRPAIRRCGSEYFLLWIKGVGLKGEFLDNNLDHAAGPREIDLSSTSVVTEPWRYDAAYDPVDGRVLVVWDTGGRTAGPKLWYRFVDQEAHTTEEPRDQRLVESEAHQTNPALVSLALPGETPEWDESAARYAFSWVETEVTDVGLKFALLDVNAEIIDTITLSSRAPKNVSIAYDGTRAFVVYDVGGAFTRTIYGTFASRGLDRGFVTETVELASPPDDAEFLETVLGPHVTYNGDTGRFMVAYRRVVRRPFGLIDDDVHEIHVLDVGRDGTVRGELSRKGLDKEDRSERVRALDWNDAPWLAYDSYPTRDSEDFETAEDLEKSEPRIRWWPLP